MSLTGALNAALSGLNVSQASLALVAQNVANANNPDYRRKLAVQEAQVTDGAVTGVQIAEIKRTIDEFLLRDVRASTSDFGRYDAQTPFLDRLQAFFGDPDSETTLSSRLDQVFAAFETAGTLNDNPTARSEVVFALDILGREIQRAFDQIQALRTDAEHQIVDDIADVNLALARIEVLNEKIVREVAAGRQPQDLLDQRDAQLAVIAQRLSVTSYVQGDGALVVMAGRGMVLLDQEARVLDYSPANIAQPETVFDTITVRRASQLAGTGTPLGQDILSGRLRGLLDVRDGALADAASELGEFAARLADEVNRVHNDNVAFPPPAALTGSRNTGLVAADAHNFTGRVTFSVMDPTVPGAGGWGVVASVTVDFDAGTVEQDFSGAPVVVPLTTIQNVLDAVNGANGLNGAATLSLSGGVMSLAAATATNGVGTAQDATVPSDRGGRGFSHFFALNDLLVTTTPRMFEHGFAAADTHLFTGDTRFTVLDANGETVTTVTVTPVAGTFAGLVTQLDTALTVGGTPYASFALDANGRLVMTEAAGYTVLASDSGPPATSDRGGTGIGLASLLGLGADKVQRIASNIAVNPAILADNDRLAIAKLQGAALNDPGATPGDARGAQALAAIATTAVAINGAGNLSARTTTLSAYVGALLGDAAIQARNADGQRAEFKLLSDTLSNMFQSIAGVNVDEELATMIVLQNAYSASARLITAVSQMFDDLMAIAT